MRPEKTAVNNLFNEDFVEFIKAFNKTKVEYLLVGGYSVIIHGYNRATGDMDLWVRRSADNYKKIVKAFSIFRMPLFDMTADAFLNEHGNNVYTFGRKPVAIDIMTSCKGLDFDDTFKSAKWIEFEGLQINVINLDNLIQAKKASGRHKDLDDIEKLTN